MQAFDCPPQMQVLPAQVAAQAAGTVVLPLHVT